VYKSDRALRRTIEVTGTALVYALGGWWHNAVVDRADLARAVALRIAQRVILFVPPVDGGLVERNVRAAKQTHAVACAVDVVPDLAPAAVAIGLALDRAQIQTSLFTLCEAFKAVVVSLATTVSLLLAFPCRCVVPVHLEGGFTGAGHERKLTKRCLAGILTAGVLTPSIAATRSTSLFTLCEAFKAVVVSLATTVSLLLAFPYRGVVPVYGNGGFTGAGFEW
jgi:hypothetical protein